MIFIYRKGMIYLSADNFKGDVSNKETVKLNQLFIEVIIIVSRLVFFNTTDTIILSMIIV